MSDETSEDGLVVGFCAVHEFSSVYVAAPQVEMTLMCSSHAYYAVFSNACAAALQVEMILMCWSH